MKKIIWLSLVSIIFFSCAEKKHGPFVVSGKILNAPEQMIYLQEIPFAGEQPVVLDSASLKKSGTFELRSHGKEEGLYRLQLEKGAAILVVNDSKNIRVKIDMAHFRLYEVEGSPATASLHELMEKYHAQDSMLYNVLTELDNAQKQKANDSILTVISLKRDIQVKAVNTFISDFIKNSPSPAVRYYAIGLASRTMKAEELKALAILSADEFKEHDGLAKLKSMLTVQAANSSTPPSYPLLNQQAPEITMPDVNGKMVSLSSFKGKFVLVDFWASWCGPCRNENPNVVTAYQKFKDKNFTVLGVSLDEGKSEWLQAIKDDGLSWTQISDMKKWESSAVSTYKFDGIPFNVLIDPTGKIIASSLRGSDLDKKLTELLIKK